MSLQELEYQSLPSLPVPPTRLIGRAAEVAAASVQLRDRDVRLLTLVGPGGVGKTRLALAIADDVSSDFSDGVSFVDLSALRDPSNVVPVVAQALDVREIRGQRLADRLRALLRPRAMLLILDNFEQVLDAAPEIGSLLGVCPRLKVLTTSRAALRLQWEHLFPVQPLALVVPDDTPPGRELSVPPAVALFVERARAVLPDFELTPDNRPAILEICARLDGLPLAIELAAAQIELLAPWALAGRLTRSSGALASFQILAGGPADLPVRQRTLRSTIEWSYRLLSPYEQALFRRLSVFAGGCTLDAAIALTTGAESAILVAAGGVSSDAPPSKAALAELAPEIVEGLGLLVDHSLLVHEIDSSYGLERYRMLETVRELGLELLAASEESELIQQRHAAICGAVADLADEGLIGADQAIWLYWLDHDHENFRVALRWAITHEQTALACRLGFGLWRFWGTRGWETEGRRWLKAVLALPGLTEVIGLRQRVAWAAGRLALDQADNAEASVLLAESLSLARRLGDQMSIADSLTQLGHVASAENDYAGARACHDEALAIRRTIGDRRGTGISLLSLGVLARAQGDLVQAPLLLEEALVLFRDVHDQFSIAATTGHLVDAAFDANDLSRARTMLVESLDALRVLGARFGVARCLERWAALASAQGRRAAAIRLAGAASALRTARGEPLSTAEAAQLERMLRPARSALPAEVARQEWALGRAMTMDEAIRFALDLAPDTGPLADVPRLGLVPDPAFPLTLRQREVAALVARGLTNQEIASALVISPRTAESHVQSILTKLDLTSRSQLAVWTHRHGIAPSPH
jgi:predicted ATPase/DNA-binding CsgD family transcriptional regulator